MRFIYDDPVIDTTIQILSHSDLSDADKQSVVALNYSKEGRSVDSTQRVYFTAYFKYNGTIYAYYLSEYFDGIAVGNTLILCGDYLVVLHISGEDIFIRDGSVLPA